MFLLVSNYKMLFLCKYTVLFWRVTSRSFFTRRRKKDFNLSMFWISSFWKIPASGVSCVNHLYFSLDIEPIVKSHHRFKTTNRVVSSPWPFFTGSFELAQSKLQALQPSCHFMDLTYKQGITVEALGPCLVREEHLLIKIQLLTIIPNKQLQLSKAAFASVPP